MSEICVKVDLCDFQVIAMLVLQWQWLVIQVAKVVTNGDSVIISLLPKMHIMCAKSINIGFVKQVYVNILGL